MLPIFVLSLSLLPRSFLEAVSQHYASLRSLRQRATITIITRMPDTEIRHWIRVNLAFLRPNKLRIEAETRSLALPFSTFKVVCDGKHLWQEVKGLEQVRKAPAPKDPSEALEGMSLGPTALLLSLFLGLIAQGPKEWGKGAKVMEEKPLKVRGRELRGLKVSLGGGEMVVRLWADPKTLTIWRMEASLLPTKEVPLSMTVVEEVNSVELNPSLPPETFSYRKPPNFEEVREFEIKGLEEIEPERGEWKGKKAPDFSLCDLKGQEVRLSALKGKVVLLDFWATWCLPCRRELPFIQRLHEEFAPKGLVVLAITDEEPERIRKFVQNHNYTFTVLLDPKDEVFKLYKVEAIPTLIIVGRDGVVVEHFVGLAPEREVRKALEKAGLK